MQDGQLIVMQIIRNLEIGGAQEVVRTLAAYLPNAGCRVVVCTFKDGPLREQIERLGVPVELLPDRRHGVVAFPLFILDMLRLRRALIAAVQKHQVDVIQTHLLRILDFLVLTLRYGARPHLVFWTIHNYNFTLRADQLKRLRWLLGPKRWAYRQLYRAASRWVGGLIAVSDEVEKAIIKDIGPIEEKIAVICNGVDMQRYQQSVDRAGVRRQLGLAENTRLIALVGTLKPQKGHHLLIEAAAFIQQLPDVHILFIGDGDLRAQLEAQARSAGLAERIHFLGSRSDVPELLAASDYFVLPSLWEGLPMALIEAMASGLPIVATAVSGTQQVMISGETGLLVAPGDTQALRAAMLALLSDPARAQAMGAAARRRVEACFSARKQAEEHSSLYRREWAKSIVKHPTAANV
jgi:glycosyltransferase involved in cell wall biosynthesis